MSESELINAVRQVALTHCRRHADERCEVTEISAVGAQVDPHSSEACEQAWYITVSFPDEPASSSAVRVRQV